MSLKIVTLSSTHGHLPEIKESADIMSPFIIY